LRSKLSLSDEWETPQELYDKLCSTYRIYPEIDVAATWENTKALWYHTKNDDGLEEDWMDDVWCNPPHSKTREFVIKAHEQWIKFNINILMIIPINSICSHYFEVFWHEVEVYPIFGRIRFVRDGKPSEHPSRNSYCVVIWRKR
jgi:phage N-6-adenine-methyltransferase